MVRAGFRGGIGLSGRRSSRMTCSSTSSTATFVLEQAREGLFYLWNVPQLVHRSQCGTKNLHEIGSCPVHELDELPNVVWVYLDERRQFFPAHAVLVDTSMTRQ